MSRLRAPIRRLLRVSTAVSLAIADGPTRGGGPVRPRHPLQARVGGVRTGSAGGCAGTSTRPLPQASRRDCGLLPRILGGSSRPVHGVRPMRLARRGLFRLQKVTLRALDSPDLLPQISRSKVPQVSFLMPSIYAKRRF